MAEPPPDVDISACLVPQPSPRVPAVDTAVWKEDSELTKAFGKLAKATPAVLQGNAHVHVLPLNRNLLGDLSGASPHLVTRLEQRDLVDYAFTQSRTNLSKSTFVVAVRGSPGIGKSRTTLLYIRKLMQETTHRRPIIFELGARDARKIYLLMPPHEPVTKLETQGWIAYRLLQNEVPKEWRDCEIVDIVIDPAQFPQNESQSPSRLLAALGHFFIPVCPDDRHLGGAHKEANVLLQLVLSPWTLRELEKGFPYMRFVNPTETFNRSRQINEDSMLTMREHYYILGGLPRYLVKEKANIRKQEITHAKATAHATALLDALVAGASFNDYSAERILTLFLTLRPREDENGYNPDRLYATLEFVSPVAAKAVGKIVLNKIHKDATWRGQEDSSDIGLAFRRVVQVLLSLGTEGMEQLGIRTRCRQLKKSGTKRAARDSQAEEQPVSFLLHASRDKIEQAASCDTLKMRFEEMGKAWNANRRNSKHANPFHCLPMGTAISTA